jgi:hypothetical protein
VHTPTADMFTAPSVCLLRSDQSAQVHWTAAADSAASAPADRHTCRALHLHVNVPLGTTVAVSGFDRIPAIWQAAGQLVPLNLADPP